MPGTLHGRNSRFYIGVGATLAAPIPKASSNGTAVSKYELALGVDFAEDTAQGDVFKTYVPGLPDFSGSMDMFYQDIVTAGALQHALIDAAAAGALCRFYAYPGAGAGITSVFHSGFIYLSLKGLPSDVGGLIMASFDIKAGGAISYTHP